MSNTMFGGKGKVAEVTVSSAKPGINTGFNAEEMFVLVNGIGKDGNPWKGVKFKFSGPLTVQSTVFVPMTPKAQSKWGEKDTTESVRADWIKKLQSFEATMKMYVTTYYPLDKDYEWGEYSSPEDFVAKVDDFIGICRGYLPDNVGTLSHDLLLGREEGDEWLNLPKTVRLSGRFIKLTSDTVKEIAIGNIFKKNYMFDIKAGESSKPEAADAVKNASWD